jgi:hypothetical protein
MQPAVYNKVTNFTSYASAHTAAPYPAALIDAEFDAIEETLDDLAVSLPLLQRDDGLLANGIVHPDSLSTATKALIGAGSADNWNWIPRGAWAALTTYAIGDVVETSNVSYVCATSHTASALFSTDRSAGKWIVLGTTTLTATAGAVTSTAYGGISSTNVQAALQELDDEKADLVATLALFSSASDVAKGDALIGFRQSKSSGALSGTVARTLHEKLQEFLSAKDFGMDPANTGAANATAFVAACAAASGSSLYIPSGIYVMDSVLVSNLTKCLIYGDKRGTTLHWTSIVDGLTFDSTCSDLGIDSIELYGSSVGTEGRKAIQLKAPRSTVQNCYIHDFNEGVTIHDESAVRCKIINNHFKDIKGTVSGNGYGVYTIAMHTLVHGNDFDTVGRHDVYLSGSSPQGADYSIVTSNTSYANGVQAIATNQLSTYPSLRGWVIANNTIRNAVGMGIGIGANSTDGVISANTIIAPGGNGIDFIGGLPADSYPSRIAVTGNVIRDCPTRAISIVNGSYNVIQSNIISSVSVSTLTGIAITYNGAPSTLPIGNKVSGNVLTGVTNDYLMDTNTDGTPCGLLVGEQSLGWITFADLATTPSIVQGTNFVSAPTAPTTITNFVGGFDGKVIKIFFTNGNTTINNTNCVLAGGVASVTGTASDVIQFIYKNPYWYQTGVSIN